MDPFVISSSPFLLTQGITSIRLFCILPFAEEGDCTCIFHCEWEPPHPLASPIGRSKVPTGTFKTNIDRICFFGGYGILHPKVQRWTKEIDRQGKRG